LSNLRPEQQGTKPQFRAQIGLLDTHAGDGAADDELLLDLLGAPEDVHGLPMPSACSPEVRS
jgi:hypothetical protein